MQNATIIAAGFEDARHAIARLLDTQHLRRTIVAITGPVASGKTTLANQVAHDHGGLVLSTDRYLPDYEGVSASERDEPARSDLSRLRRDLEQLRVDGIASVPIWSFHEHRRTGEETLHASELIVCEGIFALHSTISDVLSIRVFVQASPGVRWARWEQIEQSGARGWGVEKAKAHFETVADPTFAKYADAYRAAADVIVTNEGSHPGSALRL